MTKIALILLVAFLLFACSDKNPEANKKLNVLLICVDDLRPELKSFGANYISSPNIDKLASNGLLFKNHYVNAPSCGPSRYTLLTGRYGPSTNDALFLRADQIKQGKEKVTPSMPEWFKANGYTTVSVGKVSHHPGGLGGENWNNTSIIELPGAWDKSLMPVAEWEHPRGIMHGLAHGEIRKEASKMAVFQSVQGDDTSYPDGLITNEAIVQLRALSSEHKNPFFLAVGIIKPHLPFGAPKSYFDLYEEAVLPPIAHPHKPEGRSTWHNSGEFNQYNSWGKDPNNDSDFADALRKHYAACVSYADAQVGKILAELKRSGADKNTVVVLWGDHGWHLGEHAIWGKHSLFEEALQAPLIIHYPGMKKSNTKTSEIVETRDIFPTLCDLTGIAKPKFAQGISLKPLLENPNLSLNHFALAYWKEAKTIRTKTHRLILHKDGFVELYDHTTIEKETKNLANKQPKLVDKLKSLLFAIQN